MKIGNLHFKGNAADKPLAFSPTGEFLTAKDIVSAPRLGVGPLFRLDAGLQLKLVLKRYEMEPDFKLGMFQHGLLTKAQVIENIKDKTDLGQLAVQVEMAHCTELISSLTARSAKLLTWPILKPVKIPTFPPWKIVQQCIWFPMKTRAVFCENTTNGVTSPIAGYRIANVHPVFTTRGFTVVSLEGTNDVPAQFAPQAENGLTTYLSGIGHGNQTTYTGYNELSNIILQVGHYVASEVSGKAIHFLSCETAAQLGPDTVTHGALCYAGYDQDFNMAWANETEHMLFAKADSTFDISMANGYTAGQAYTATIQAFNAAIAQVPGSAAAGWLQYDRDHLRLLGNVATQILPYRWFKVCFPLKTIEKENALVAACERAD